MECVTVCDDDALRMVAKNDDVMVKARKSHQLFKNMGPSNEKYISGNLPIDLMLKEQTRANASKLPRNRDSPWFTTNPNANNNTFFASLLRECCVFTRDLDALALPWWVRHWSFL